jgi:hypothetical protein
MQGNKVKFPICQPNKAENVSTTLTLDSKSLTFSQHPIQPFKNSHHSREKKAQSSTATQHISQTFKQNLKSINSPTFH